MTRWEYLVVDLGNQRIEYDQDELNAYGKDGWELAGIAITNSSTLAYMKRPTEPSGKSQESK